MKRIGVAVSMVVLSASIAGCGVGELSARWGPESTTVLRIDPALAANEVVAKTRRSVVKVHGEADSCMKIIDGSGFVAAPHRVMTNAHVVAGAARFSVDADGKTYDAQVISYDPQADLAILDVPGLSAQPLTLARYTAGTGTDALVLGYPGAHPFTASPVQVRQSAQLNGPDIYHLTSGSREVYILTGTIPESGSSGSAVVDLYGQVLGVYFGAETNSSTTGFAITAAQAAPQLTKAQRLLLPASTGACVN